MIIAGIYSYNNPIDTKQIAQVQSIIAKEVVGQPQILCDKNLFLLAGTVAKRGNKDSILISENRLLAGKVYSRTNTTIFSKANLMQMRRGDDACRELLDNYWGTYIYVEYDATENKLIILGDFSQQISIFYCQGPDNTIIFASSMKALCSILGNTPSFNWDYLNTFLLHGNLLTESTPFTAVSEIAPGYILTISPKETKICQYWDPTRYINSGNSDYFESNVLNVMSNVMQCSISQAEAIALDFSGGLDSSILLSSIKELASKHQTIIPINMSYKALNASDETIYARSIAQKHNLNLTELDQSEYLPFSPTSKLSFIPDKPSVVFANLKREQSFIQPTAGYSNCVYLNGHGGDSIFMAVALEESLVDYLLQHGITGLHAKIHDMAVYRRTSIVLLYKYLFSKLTRHMFKYKTAQAQPHFNTPWLNKNMRQYHVNKMLHPCLKNKSGLLPGKKIHLEDTFATIASVNVNMREANNAIIYPFLTQPMIELSLNLPTYETLKLNYSRYPLRKIVDAHYNSPHFWRQSKGEYSGALSLGIKNNFAHILELCMDGVFAKSGFIERDLFQKNLRDIINGDPTYQWTLMHLVSLEMYLEYWRR
jgi:asparagine synthase (glutamine-hydrolysing)